MMKLTMQILSSNYVMLHILIGNILLLQTIPILRKAGPRMISVRFVTKLQWMQHVQSSGSYLRASCLGPN